MPLGKVCPHARARPPAGQSDESHGSHTLVERLARASCLSEIVEDFESLLATPFGDQPNKLSIYQDKGLLLMYEN